MNIFPTGKNLVVSRTGKRKRGGVKCLERIRCQAKPTICAVKSRAVSTGGGFAGCTTARFAEEKILMAAIIAIRFDITLRYLLVGNPRRQRRQMSTRDERRRFIRRISSHRAVTV